MPLTPDSLDLASNVTVCVSIFNRPLYTRRSLISLQQHWRGKVLLVDDGSSEENFEALSSIAPAHWKIFRNTNNLGITEVVLSFLDHTDSPYLYITDNDALYSPEFRNKITQAVEKGFQISSLFYSKARCPFGNSLITSLIPDPKGFRETRSGEWRTTPSFGGISVLIERRVLEDFRRFYREVNGTALSLAGGWDWLLSHYCIKHGIDQFQSDRSYVRHIGRHGDNSLPFCFDVAHDYQGSLADIVLTRENFEQEKVELVQYLAQGSGNINLEHLRNHLPPSQDLPTVSWNKWAIVKNHAGAKNGRVSSLINTFDTVVRCNDFAGAAMPTDKALRTDLHILNEFHAQRALSGNLETAGAGIVIPVDPKRLAFSLSLCLRSVSESSKKILYFIRPSYLSNILAINPQPSSTFSAAFIGRDLAAQVYMFNISRFELLKVYRSDYLYRDDSNFEPANTFEERALLAEWDLEQNFKIYPPASLVTRGLFRYLKLRPGAANRLSQ